MIVQSQLNTRRRNELASQPYRKLSFPLFDILDRHIKRVCGTIYSDQFWTEQIVELVVYATL